MATTAPSLSELSARIRGAFRQELPGTDATIWPNTLYVIGKVVALLLFEAHLRIDWLYKQLFASTATARHLERHAYELGLARKAASRATGSLTTTGAGSTTYPAGLRYLSGRNAYVSTAAATSAADGALTIPVRAEQPGAAGNRNAGETLTLVDSALHPGLGKEATVGAAGLGGGADAESDDSLRDRVLARKRKPPQGGSEADYEQFALAVPGVSRAWARGFVDGPGTIGVWFLFEGRENGIPTAADVAAVQAALDERRMIRVSAVANAPVPVEVDVALSIAPDTAAVRAAVEANIAAMLATRCRPGLPDEPFVLSRSWIAEAIAQTLDEESHTLTAPAGDVTFTSGQYPVLGTVSWT